MYGACDCNTYPGENKHEKMMKSPSLHSIKLHPTSAACTLTNCEKNRMLMIIIFMKVL